jgi:hypothetical protein
MNDPTPAEARHLVSNLVCVYTDMADTKDIAAATRLLRDTVVSFPTDGYDRPEDAPAFWGRLWGNDIPHRHDVSNVVVEAVEGTSGRRWRARAHYLRWIFTPEPVLHTLGEYDLRVDIDSDATAATFSELTVTRTWTRPPS